MLMNFNAEEQKIRDLMSRQKFRPVPEFVMKDYAEGVMRKIKAPAEFPYGAALALSLAFALALAGTAAFVILRKAPAQVPDSLSSPNVFIGDPNSKDVRQSSRGEDSRLKHSGMTQKKPEIAVTPLQTTEVIDTARMDKLSQEIFILEMLGEDTGLDNASRLQSDMDLISAGPAGA